MSVQFSNRLQLFVGSYKCIPLSKKESFLVVCFLVPVVVYWTCKMNCNGLKIVLRSDILYCIWSDWSKFKQIMAVQFSSQASVGGSHRLHVTPWSGWKRLSVTFSSWLHYCKNKKVILALFDYYNCMTDPPTLPVLHKIIGCFSNWWLLWLQMSWWDSGCEKLIRG